MPELSNNLYVIDTSALLSIFYKDERDSEKGQQADESLLLKSKQSQLIFRHFFFFLSAVFLVTESKSSNK